MTPAHRLTLAAAILAADVPEDARLEALALLVGAAPAAPAQELPADPVERRRVLAASRARAYRARRKLASTLASAWGPQQGDA